jgi:thioredoxin reductase (NADPH)
MMIRGEGLAASMSRNLIDRIEVAPNMEVMTATEIVALEGRPDTRLDHLRCRNRKTGEETVGDIRNVFLFAVDDARAGSIKRVGAAIGEGAQVVAALHPFLADSLSPTF